MRYFAEQMFQSLNLLQLMNSRTDLNGFLGFFLALGVNRNRQSSRSEHMEMIAVKISSFKCDVGLSFDL